MLGQKGVQGLLVLEGTAWGAGRCRWGAGQGCEKLGPLEGQGSQF